jgi:hypothetical protein
MRNISTAVSCHYDDDRYMWAIIIRRFCDRYTIVAAYTVIIDDVLPRATHCHTRLTTTQTATSHVAWPLLTPPIDPCTRFTHAMQ